MSAAFHITADPSRKLLNVRMSGFYEVADVERYHAAVHEATAKLPGTPAEQRMICDIGGMRIQAQDTVAAFARVMGDPKYRQRKVAFVIATSLARQQAQRVLGERQAKIFATYREAHAWLFGEAQASAA